MVKVKVSVWTVLVIVVLAASLAATAGLILPSYASPSSRSYGSSLGLPALLRRLGRPIPVTGALAVERAMSDAVVAEGMTVAEQVSNVNSPVAGQVVAVQVAEGAQVRPGDLLVELDPTQVEFSLAEAENSLASARALLQATSTGQREEVVRQKQIALSHADSVLDLSRTRFEREKRLYEMGVSSRTDLEDREQEYQDALAAQLTAREELEVAGSGRSEDVEVAIARVSSAASGVDTVRHSLSLRHVVAPMSGVVTQVDINPGEYNWPVGRRLLTIERGILFRAEIDQSEAGRVVPGQDVEISLSAHPGRPIPGRVIRISPTTVLAGNPRGRRSDMPVTFPAWISLVEDAASRPPLISGMTGFTRIVIARQVLAVPASAVVYLSGSEGLVFVAENGRVRSRRVRNGLSRGGYTEISDGLKAGDTVITAGQRALREGDSVDVTVDGPVDRH